MAQAFHNNFNPSGHVQYFARDNGVQYLQQRLCQPRPLQTSGDDATNLSYIRLSPLGFFNLGVSKHFNMSGHRSFNRGGLFTWLSGPLWLRHIKDRSVLCQGWRLDRLIPMDSVANSSLQANVKNGMI